uniref:protein SHI RELATED SEQUENCE 1-like n=1 Tax=Erigeron canadensis TaxID=72917 RepID=UPI001CB8EA49|nr:protein SHI RELATED SEQUENCE 1-like [Erigeron canadensis]
MRCLECGNKAKKDCLYYRCRSCCRGREFECQTHVKSTWVPISTRQVVRNSVAAMAAASSAAAGPSHHDRHQQEEQQLLDPQSSFGFGGQFPTEVSSEATFTCVRVTTSLEENASVEEYAYETSINIRGHVFKGILYDQGPNQPMVNSSVMIVHDGDRHPSTNIDSNFQQVNNP